MPESTSSRFPITRLRRVFALPALAFVTAAAAAVIDASRLDAARALFFERGKSFEAQKAYEAIAAEDPTNAQAHFHLGLLALRRDDADQAVSYLQRAVELAPNDSESHRALGDAYGRSAQKASIFRQLGFAKKCLASYQRAVALDPGNLDARSCLFDYYRMAPGFVGGSSEKALAEAAEIKQRDPARGRIAFATFYVSEKQYDKALAEFDEVLKNNPDDYRALYQVGRLAALTGRFLDRGIASLRRCLELAPPAAPQMPGPAVVQWRLGTLLEKKGDALSARAAYTAALKIDPDFTAAADALKNPQRFINRKER